MTQARGNRAGRVATVVPSDGRVRRVGQQRAGVQQISPAWPGGQAVPESWQFELEVIGAELFLRYRKRLMSPGIALAIRRDYPGLSLIDVLVRVHAGRRIIEARGDFRALRAIHSGAWQRYLAQRAAGRDPAPAAADRLSFWLVRIGGVFFAGFCVLSLLAAVRGALGVPPTVGLATFCLTGALVWWLSVRHAAGSTVARRAAVRDCVKERLPGSVFGRTNDAASVL